MTKHRKVQETDVRFSLRVYAFLLLKISDWQIMDGLIEPLREALEKKTTRSMFTFPLKNGIAYYLGCWAIDEFFAALAKRRPGSRQVEDIPTLIEAVAVAWEISGLPADPVIHDKEIAEFFGAYDDCQDASEEYALLLNGGIRTVRRFARLCLKSESYSDIRHAYALESADRIVHDRQVSSEIARIILHYIPDSERQYARRVKWPGFVKPLVLSRDRGKCANCHTDISIELLADAHIDHMYPLAAGGCNDVINLQLLCANCNTKKSDKSWSVKSSVPTYHRR
jgi:5-methylcytosine-specific restriction endonuclease McrA